MSSLIVAVPVIEAPPVADCDDDDRIGPDSRRIDDSTPPMPADARLPDGLAPPPSSPSVPPPPPLDPPVLPPDELPKTPPRPPPKPPLRLPIVCVIAWILGDTTAWMSVWMSGMGTGDTMLCWAFLTMFCLSSVLMKRVLASRKPSIFYVRANVCIRYGGAQWMGMMYLVCARLVGVLVILGMRWTNTNRQTRENIGEQCW